MGRKKAWLKLQIGNQLQAVQHSTNVSSAITSGERTEEWVEFTEEHCDILDSGEIKLSTGCLSLGGAEF